MIFGSLKSFRHGIHPPESKEDTSELPIRQFPFAPVMILPLQQHLGAPSKPVVWQGAEVQRGQLLAEPEGYMSVALHSPAEGTIRKIDLAPSIQGRMAPAIYLEPFPGSTQDTPNGAPCKLETATPEEIQKAIQMAGLVGLGGAAFPTHVKLKIPEGKTVDTLVINGVECEPYLTTDHRIMLERPDDVIMGVRYLLKATGAPKAMLGIEANKPDAIEILRAAVPDDLPLEIHALEVKYPQGAEKMLVAALLGKEIPSGGLPIDCGVVSINVATTAEIGRLLPKGRGIMERVITIGGPAISKKGNYLIPIGTPLRFALEQAGVCDDVGKVFLGGPMMGQALSSLDIPITKGTSGFIAFREEDLGAADKVYPCIHCGYCVDACPLFLNPSALGLLALKNEVEVMTEEYNLMDCFECGSCSYVCPAHIPLVQHFRASKALMRKRKSAEAS